MMIRATGASMIVLLVYTAFSQSASSPRAFEVASIRAHPGPLHAMETYSISGPRLNGEGVSVSGLVMYAYNLKRFQISDPPHSPVDDIFYDLVAKAEGDGTPTKDQFRQMVQSLLADRFKLKVHREMREMPVYALVVGKNGPKLKDSAPDASPTGHVGVNGRNYEVTMPKASMHEVVSIIINSGFLGRPVIDKTGLTGTYDLRLAYTPNTNSNREGEQDARDITIFTAVQEQLGLKLEAQKAMVEILVVDHVEKPSEN